MILGSPELVRSPADADPIDEFRILVHSVTAEVGERLLDGIQPRANLDLKNVTALSQGGVLASRARAEP